MPYDGIPLGSLDSRFVNITGDTMTGALSVTGTMAATTVTGANVTTGADPGHTHTLASIPDDLILQVQVFS